MKQIFRLLLVVVCLLSLVGCQSYFDGLNDEALSDNIRKDYLYYNDSFGEYLDVYPEPYALFCWIHENIKYKGEPKGEDFQQTAEETVTLGTGDCEDLCVLFMNMAYVTMGVKYDLVSVDGNRKVEKGGYTNHACIRDSEGNVYCVQLGQKVDYKVGYSYDFDLFFYE